MEPDDARHATATSGWRRGRWWRRGRRRGRWWRRGWWWRAWCALHELAVGRDDIHHVGDHGVDSRSALDFVCDAVAHLDAVATVHAVDPVRPLSAREEVLTATAPDDVGTLAPVDDQRKDRARADESVCAIAELERPAPDAFWRAGRNEDAHGAVGPTRRDRFRLVHVEVLDAPERRGGRVREDLVGLSVERLEMEGQLTGIRIDPELNDSSARIRGEEAEREGGDQGNHTLRHEANVTPRRKDTLRISFGMSGTASPAGCGPRGPRRGPRAPARARFGRARPGRSRAG